jgi:hypothetical protein
MPREQEIRFWEVYGANTANYLSATRIKADIA